MNRRIYVIDETGVETLWADRDASWLIAVAAQLDDDIAAARRRHETASVALCGAVAALADRGGR